MENPSQTDTSKSSVRIIGLNAIHDESIMVLTIATPRSEQDALYETIVYFQFAAYAMGDERHEAERIVHSSHSEALQGHEDLLAKWRDAKRGLCLDCWTEDNGLLRGWILEGGKGVCSELPYSEHYVCSACTSDSACETHPNYCISCSDMEPCDRHRPEA